MGMERLTAHRPNDTDNKYTQISAKQCHTFQVEAMKRAFRQLLSVQHAQGRQICSSISIVVKESNIMDAYGRKETKDHPDNIYSNKHIETRTS